jgi:hypothetical protein
VVAGTSFEPMELPVRRLLVVGGAGGGLESMTLPEADAMGVSDMEGGNIRSCNSEIRNGYEPES